jgi:hypothetical protein
MVQKYQNQGIVRKADRQIGRRRTGGEVKNTNPIIKI